MLPNLGMESSGTSYPQWWTRILTTPIKVNKYRRTTWEPSTRGGMPTTRVHRIRVVTGIQYWCGEPTVASYLIYIIKSTCHTILNFFAEP